MSTKNAFHLLALALMLAAPLARADVQAKTPNVDETRPWAEGVSHEQREAAVVLFKEANQLLKDSFFAQAAAKYREALTHWDHPAIHYNLVLALLNLDQPVEVYRNLQAAIRYGPAPLDEDKYKQAQTYLALIGKQVARVSISCQVKGARVVMDGQPLFVGPGRYDGLIRSGPHTIVATAQGYLTNETTRSFDPGKQTELDLQLFTNSDLTRYKRRWSAWIPWTVIGGGVAVALGGGLLHAHARSAFNQYDQAITACGGCVPSAEVNSTLSSGNRSQAIAIASYAVGGAAIATGAVLLYLNRLQPYHVTPDELAGKSLAVVPVVGKGEGGLMARVQF